MCTYSYEDNSLKLNGTYKYYVSAKLSDKLDDSYTQTLASNVVELSVKTGEQETGTTGLDYTIPTCLANNVAAKSTVLNPNRFRKFGYYFYKSRRFYQHRYNFLFCNWLYNYCCCCFCCVLPLKGKVGKARC